MTEKHTEALKRIAYAGPKCRKADLQEIAELALRAPAGNGQADAMREALEDMLSGTRLTLDTAVRDNLSFTISARKLAKARAALAAADPKGEK